MQLTGQVSMQCSSFVQVSMITYAIFSSPPPLWPKSVAVRAIRMSPLDGFRRLGCSKGERASVMTITARRDGLPVQRPGSSDLNHDGKSTRDELFTLDQVGISSISLAYTIDPYVNAVG